MAGISQKGWDRKRNVKVVFSGLTRKEQNYLEDRLIRLEQGMLGTGEQSVELNYWSEMGGRLCIMVSLVNRETFYGLFPTFDLDTRHLNYFYGIVRQQLGE